MIMAILAFTTYFLLLNIIKTKNIQFITIKDESYLICDEPICL